MNKKKLIENLKSILGAILAFILVVGFFSWYSTVYNYTLISFRYLFLISLLISIPFLVYFYKNGFNDLFRGISFSPLIISLFIYVSGLLFLSINYITHGESIEKEHRIIDAYHQTVNRKKRYYVKIKWKKEVIELQLFSKDFDGPLNGKKKIILETKHGLLGFDVIKKIKLK